MWSIKNLSFCGLLTILCACATSVACFNTTDEFTTASAGAAGACDDCTGGAASGGASASGGEGGDGCIPGSEHECGCNQGFTGVQICQEDGESYGPCNCEDSTPSGGTSGNDGCVPGEQRGCLVPGICTGVQVCDSARCWSYCVCGNPSPTGGTGGMGATGGTGAIGGTGGGDNCLCNPGDPRNCYCLGGYIGTQYCANDCQSLTVCDCPAPPTGGTGGMGGTGGSGATGGTGGGEQDVTLTFSYELPASHFPVDLTRVYIYGQALWYDANEPLEENRWKYVPGHSWRSYCDSRTGNLLDLIGYTYSCEIVLPAQGVAFDFQWYLEGYGATVFPSGMGTQWACYAPTGSYELFGTARVNGDVVESTISNDADGCNMTIWY